MAVSNDEGRKQSHCFKFKSLDYLGQPTYVFASGSPRELEVSFLLPIPLVGIYLYCYLKLLYSTHKL
jgi:hypothetical protein